MGTDFQKMTARRSPYLAGAGSPSVEMSSSPATDRVGEMMRSDSRLSQLSKPSQEENESKAHYAWRLIKLCVAEATELVERSLSSEIVINHGIDFQRSLNHMNPIEHLVYNQVTQVSVVYIINFLFVMQQSIYGICDMSTPIFIVYI